LAFVALLAFAGLLARALPAAGRVSGHELEPPQLVPAERGAPEGVVLFTREQMPEQHAQLAAGSDERDLRAAPGPQALVVGTQGTGRAHRDPGGLAEHVPGFARSLLGDSPVTSRRLAGLAHPRVEPDV